MTTTKNEKPGWKTTEFWLAAIKGVFGLLALFGVHPAMPPIVSTAVAIGGGILATGSTVGYSLSRGKAKAPEAPPKS
jgi:hypothetical protein